MDQNDSQQSSMFRSNFNEGSSFVRIQPGTQREKQSWLMNRSMIQGSFVQHNQSYQEEQENNGGYIWGTRFSIEEGKRKITRFLTHFNPENYNPQQNNGLSFYLEKMLQIKETCIFYMIISAEDLFKFDHELYFYLIKYPAETILLLDQIVNKVFVENILNAQERVNFDKIIRVRIIDLKETHQMRHLSPQQINTLVSLKGIFIRCSEIIPEPKEVFFRCSTPGCEQCELRPLERGRVNEPIKCMNCNCKHSFEVVYNLSTYADKQYIKFQERPDEVPEGETPINVNLVVYDDLVDECKPGDSIQIIGIYRAEPSRVQKNRTKVHSVFRSYIDVVSIVYENKNKVVLNNELRQDRDKIEYSEQEVDEFRRFARDPLLYDKLVSSFAPSLFGLKKTKLGLLCQMFGGTKKSFNTLQRGRFRSEINTLLIGDPSTAKSQFLCFVNKIAPRGIYTSGKGSSAVGLTAYVSTDPETHEIVLESGALVLSDHGICCIDEFDKMDEGTQSILHEAMEQQTISVAKKGIVCSLNARTSILAAANPKESRYNPARSIVYNLNLSPSLLSRFDLIYLMLDQAREEEDRELSLHIIGLFSNDKLKGTRQEDIHVSQNFLTKYISYARENVHPRLSDDAERELIKGYLQMRQLGTSRKVITATPRQLESMIRLAEARAKMRLSNLVTKDDVLEAVELIRVATQAAAIDPSTGQIDMNQLATGVSSNYQKQVEQIKSILTVLIGELEENLKNGMSATLIMEEIQKRNKELNDVNPKILVLSLQELENQHMLQIIGDKDHPERMNFQVKILPVAK